MTRGGNGVNIHITERAAEHIRQVLEEKGASALRVFVAGGGCSGYQYGMVIAHEIEEDDFVIEQQDVTIVIDSQSASFLEGAEIDYVEDVMKSGFAVFNPNAVRSCACGTSFSTKEEGGHPQPCQ
ncbi:MAG: iron-sulfur cluster insertion protein ErpA [Candidatus Terrybacteria bacterium]|nr:iron-sulfur cluster insertion protein ErpA [Candidatus Terrybacteria bacterium]